MTIYFDVVLRLMPGCPLYLCCHFLLLKKTRFGEAAKDAVPIPCAESGHNSRFF